jgi:hypothetical protein
MSGLFGRPSFAMLSPPIAFMGETVNLFISSIIFCYDGLGGQIHYSDFQHKGNVGEGQFHINSRTVQVHLDHYLHKTLTYDELLHLLTCDS